MGKQTRVFKSMAFLLILLAMAVSAVWATDFVVKSFVKVYTGYIGPILGDPVDIDLTSGTITGGTINSGILKKVANKTTSYSTLDSDTGYILAMSNPAPATVTVSAGHPIGTNFEIVNMLGSDLVINPPDTDIFLGIANAEGDSLTNTTIGNSIGITKTGVITWTVGLNYGTWADGN